MKFWQMMFCKSSTTFSKTFQRSFLGIWVTSGDFYANLVCKWTNIGRKNRTHCSGTSNNLFLGVKVLCMQTFSSNIEDLGAVWRYFLLDRTILHPSLNKKAFNFWTTVNYAPKRQLSISWVQWLRQSVAKAILSQTFRSKLDGLDQVWDDDLPS